MTTELVVAINRLKLTSQLASPACNKCHCLEPSPPLSPTILATARSDTDDPIPGTCKVDSYTPTHQVSLLETEPGVPRTQNKTHSMDNRVGCGH
jgi:hypothetical protein